MSFVTSLDVKEQVRQSTDIVDLVGSSIQLRRAGRNFAGLCPWHDDSKPSLIVNPERQSWKCWVCDVGGDVYSYVMQREGVGFREALELLADRAGIALTDAVPSAPGAAEHKRSLYEAVAWAEEQFHQCLLRSSDAEPARRYLEDRGVTPASVERFRIGYSPAGWQWLLDRARSTSFSPSILESVGLVATSAKSGKHYDRFRERVIFSIRDTQDRPIAFGGRVMPGATDAAKYINSPESRLFSKSDQLYGLHLARNAAARSKRIIVVEGYTDVVMAHQYGREDVVACLGTALNERHIRVLRRFADSITLLLDGDEAGQRRTNEILELFVAAQVDLRIQTLPAGLDPCDFLIQHGADAFGELVAEGIDALEHKIRSETHDIDVTTDLHQANQAIESILGVMARAPRGLTSQHSHHLRQHQVLARLARQFQIDEQPLRDRLRELQRRLSVSKRTEPHRNSAVAESPQAALTPVENEMLEIIFSHPHLAPRVIDSLGEEILVSEPARHLIQIFDQLIQQSSEPSFDRVITLVEDARLKNLIVDLDEQARQKNEQTESSADERLEDLIRTVESQASRTTNRQRQRDLQTKDLDEREEIAILQEIIDRERNRQGI